MSTLQERFLECLKSASSDKSRAGLARHVGVSRTTVTLWFNGPTSTLDGENLLRAADYFSVNPAWLATGKGHKELSAPGRQAAQALGPSIQTPLRPVRAIDNPDEAEHDLVLIPRYTLQASCGAGEPVLDIDELGEPNYARRSWARRRGLDPERLFSVVAVGDSMEPEISDGDGLIVHRQQTIEDNKLMVICYRGECYVKRVLRNFDGSLSVKSTNPDYADVTITPDQVDELHVVGRVVSIARNV